MILLLNLQKLYCRSYINLIKNVSYVIRYFYQKVNISKYIFLVERGGVNISLKIFMSLKVIFNIGLNIYGHIGVF